MLYRKLLSELDLSMNSLLISKLSEVYKVQSLENYNGIRGSYKITINDTQEIDLYLYEYSDVYSLTLCTNGSGRSYRLSRYFSEGDSLNRRLELITEDIGVLIRKEQEYSTIPEIEDFHNIQTKIDNQLELTTNDLQAVTAFEDNSRGGIYNIIAQCGSLYKLYIRVVMNLRHEFIIEQITLSSGNLLDDVYYVFKSPQDMFLKVCDILVSCNTQLDNSAKLDILQIISIISNAVTR